MAGNETGVDKRLKHGLTPSVRHGGKVHPMYWRYRSWLTQGYEVCPEWRENPSLIVEWVESQHFKKGDVIRRRDTSQPFGPDNCYLKTPNPEDWWNVRHQEEREGLDHKVSNHFQTVQKKSLK